MKPYIKSFFLILVLFPPLLAASALMISEGFSGNSAVSFTSADFQWYFNLFIWLWFFSLPAAPVYAGLAAALKLRRGWRAAAISAALGSGLAAVSIAAGELTMGDGFVEWDVVASAAICTGMAAAVISACLPKHATVAD
ncbi:MULTISPECIES: hypothetical protein [Eikenella]|uniref:hypothetical protein n=1 Tax=Eikenella TaxID=538 RepID=UPI000AB85A41|nr:MULTISPECIES: hypothetical protein [Eikenella]